MIHNVGKNQHYVLLFSIRFDKIHVGKSQQVPFPAKKKKGTLMSNILGEKPPLSIVSKKSDRIHKRQVTAYDENGEILYDVIQKPRKENGSGFVISYTEKICELLAKIPTGSVIRVFFYIAHNQQYGSDGKTFGYRCSKKHLCEVLRMDRTVVWEALKTLRENYLVLESNIDGQSEFMVNPNYITIGNSKRERLREWSRRWEEYFKRTGGKL